MQIDKSPERDQRQDEETCANHPPTHTRSLIPLRLSTEQADGLLNRIVNRSPSLVPSSTRVLSVTLRFARRPSDGFFLSASFKFLICEGLCSILVGSETHNELRMEYGYVLVQYSMKVQQQARSHRTVPSQRRLFQPSHHRHRSQRSLRRFSDEARKASQLMASSEGLEGLKSTTSSLRRSVRLPRRSRGDRAVFRPTRTMTTSCRKSSMKKWRHCIFQHSVRRSMSRYTDFH